MQETLDRLAAGWALTIDAPPIETPAGLVAFVHRGGAPAVLKIHGPRSDEHRSADVLAHYAGSGAVRLLERDPAGLLIERATPGTELASLVRAGDDDRATAIVADTIAALRARTGPVDGLPTARDLGRGFARYRQGGGDRRIEPALVARAQELYAELAASQPEPVVLHGDLHHYNILHDTRRDWLAIDPKGMTSEPAYEVGASLRNPIEDPALFARPAIIARRLAIYTERLGYDPKRMAGWCFAQAVLSALWAIEDGTDPAFGIACAEAALPLLSVTS